MLHIEPAYRWMVWLHQLQRWISTCNCISIPKYTQNTLLRVDMCEKYYNPEHVKIHTALLYPRLRRHRRPRPHHSPVCSAFAIHCNVWLQSSVITMATIATHSPSISETMTATTTYNAGKNNTPWLATQVLRAAVYMFAYMHQWVRVCVES